MRGFIPIPDLGSDQDRKREQPRGRDQRLRRLPGRGLRSRGRSPGHPDPRLHLPRRRRRLAAHDGLRHLPDLVGNGNNLYYHVPYWVGFKLDEAHVQGGDNECSEPPGHAAAGGQGGGVGCLKGWFVRSIRRSRIDLDRTDCPRRRRPDDGDPRQLSVAPPTIGPVAESVGECANRTRGPSSPSTAAWRAPCGTARSACWGPVSCPSGTGSGSSGRRRSICSSCAYAIDAVFVDGGGRVVRVVENLRPWRIVAWARGARDCLELPSGSVGADRDDGRRPAGSGACHRVSDRYVAGTWSR